MKRKYRIIIWLIIALLIPIGIFIYEGGYNSDAMWWIVFVAVLATVFSNANKDLTKIANQVRSAFYNGEISTEEYKSIIK